MKELNFSVLVYDGPIARAYLTRLRRQGIRPAVLYRLASKNDAHNKKPLMSWLPGFLRKPYCLKYQDIQQNYWPRQLLSSHPQLAAAASAGLREVIPDAAEQIQEMSSPAFHFAEYAQRSESLLVDGLADPALAQFLQTRCSAPILYTGGGLVPQSLLSLPGARFLHLHPGYLPLVRGADGLLWSVALRGKPGISAFWMAPGLDTGDLLATHELPPLQMPLAQRPDDATLYRALFAYVDPLIRAHFLGDRLTTLLSASGAPQNEDDGVTLHFMHPHLKSRILQKLFPAP